MAWNCVVYIVILDIRSTSASDEAEPERDECSDELLSKQKQKIVQQTKHGAFKCRCSRVLAPKNPNVQIWRVKEKVNGDKKSNSDTNNNIFDGLKTRKQTFKMLTQHNLIVEKN